MGMKLINTYKMTDFFKDCHRINFLIFKKSLVPVYFKKHQEDTAYHSQMLAQIHIVCNRHFQTSYLSLQIHIVSF